MKTVNFTDKVFAFTAENALFSAPCHLLVAVSGGPDSMALLHTLLHWPKDGLRLSVVHMNHGLRGETAVRDENFVRQYCEQHNIPLTVYLEDVSAYANMHKLSLEEAGRKLRYLRFEELRQELNASWIVTAHTASDQTETMLMHLFRGCGLDALQGIPAKRDAICRPLLSCTKDEVLRYCLDNDVPFVLDETNEDVQFTRNRIRNEVLPMLRTINPHVDAALLRFQKHITADVAYLDRFANDLLAQSTDDRGVQVSSLMAAAQPIRRRAIRLLLRQCPLEIIEESHICAIEHIALSGSGSTLLPGKFIARVVNGILSVEKAVEAEQASSFCLSVSELPMTFTACDKQYTVSLTNFADFENVHNLFLNQVLDYDTIQGGLTIRTRQSGDTLRPAGRGISKSIKKLMNEWKIPANIRDFYPLVCDETGVLLVPGFACDQRAVVTDTTKRCLIVKTHE